MEPRIRYPAGAELTKFFQSCRFRAGDFNLRLSLAFVVCGNGLVYQGPTVPASANSPIAVEAAKRGRVFSFGSTITQHPPGRS
jgi:hypothetical protein